MLQVTVEGIYESDIGSGQKKYQDFNYTFTTSRKTPKGLETHVMRRFIPLLIARDKNKKSIIFSRIKSFVITDIKNIDNSKDCIIGKEINNLDALQIQDLAATFDLYEIPLYGTCSIVELRNKAIEAYLKKVLKVPMENSKQKAELRFFKKQSDGNFVLDFTEESPLVIEMPENYFGAVKQPKEKKGLSYFFEKVKKEMNAIISTTENQPDSNNNSNDKFPSFDDLENTCVNA